MWWNPGQILWEESNPREGEKRKQGARTESPVQQRQAKMLLLKSPHTHTQTHKYRKYRDHDLWHIWDLQMGPQEQQQQLSQVNFAFCPACLSFKLKLEWLLGCRRCSNVPQLLGSPEGGFCNPVLSVYTLTYCYLMFYLYWLASLLLLLFESLSWIFFVGVLHFGGVNQNIM